MLLNSALYDEVLCWKTSSVNAFMDSGAFVHRVSALRGDFTGMWQLQLTTKHAAEDQVTRTFTKKCLPFFCFPNITKYSCLAQITLKINDLEWFWFVQ